jgi:hypothetical protein
MTFLEAVKAVPHEDWCPTGGADEQCFPYACDCDRDERIAKGIEAAIGEWQFLGSAAEHRLVEAKSVGAFQRASA